MVEAATVEDMAKVVEVEKAGEVFNPKALLRVSEAL